MSLTITLNFNSIEEARDALRRLTNGEVAEETPVPSSAKAKVQKAVKEAKQKADEAVAKVAKTKPPKEDTPDPESTPDPGTEPTYDDLKKAVNSLAAKDISAAKAVAADLGYKTFKDVPESEYLDAINAVNAKLEELEAGE